MTKNIVIIFIVGFVLTGCTVDKSKMLGSDIRLFQGTAAWELAKAVEKEDTLEIERIIKEENVPVDTKEERFGTSLLIWASYTGHYNSVKTLLKCGADPNLTDDYDGQSATVVASEYGFFSGEGDNAGYDTSVTILSLLLEYGGDPNKVCQGKHPNNMGYITTPLRKAAGCCLNKTKLLVEHGADINFGVGFQSVLFTAAIGGKDRELILKYLLIDKKADFKSKFAITLDGENDTLTLVNLLRDWIIPLDSPEYKIKMEIVDYLKQNGMDYWQTKIPERYYDGYSKDFLDKY